ncbi:MAG: hypothetical protein BMS9Abin37_1957 [Acidobacteriota bacterium]|nr:MAG: hypothetical protein BMS9Abin37_1957 [Acidobacteriota bacterium]
MHEKHAGARALSTARLLLVPALITLALTQLRLTGDLLRISGFEPYEIAWLVPIFGAYFAVFLVKSEETAPAPGRLLKSSLLPMALFGAGLLLFHPTSGGMATLSFVAIVLVRRAWPRLGTLLLGYALAARLPVIVTMLGATLNGWETVYDVSPYNVMAGLLPQLTVWIGFTVVVGVLAGAIALALRGWLRDEANPFGGSAATR